VRTVCGFGSGMPRVNDLKRLAGPLTWTAVMTGMAISFHDDWIFENNADILQYQ
jgi:hypothetical protein